MKRIYNDQNNKETRVIRVGKISRWEPTIGNEKDTTGQ